MPKNKSVVTKGELDSETKEKEQPKQVAPSKKKKEVDREFECPFAQPGESTVAFTHQFRGVEYKYNLSLMNKRYVLSKDMKPEEKERYVQALKDNNFVDVTVIEAGTTFNIQKGKFEYKVVHPEHTDRNRVNGNLSLALLNDAGQPMFHQKGKDKGKQIVKQVAIIDGLVITDDKLVYEALLKAGFYSAGKKEKEEGNE